MAVLKANTPPTSVSVSIPSKVSKLKNIISQGGRIEGKPPAHIQNRIRTQQGVETEKYVKLNATYEIEKKSYHQIGHAKICKKKGKFVYKILYRYQNKRPKLFTSYDLGQVRIFSKLWTATIYINRKEIILKLNVGWDTVVCCILVKHPYYVNIPHCSLKAIVRRCHYCQTGQVNVVLIACQ